LRVVTEDELAAGALVDADELELDELELHDALASTTARPAASTIRRGNLWRFTVTSVRG
jgi:hypothetical protein